MSKSMGLKPAATTGVSKAYMKGDKPTKPESLEAVRGTSQSWTFAGDALADHVLHSGTRHRSGVGDENKPPNRS
eukprot:12922597-Prorocentrum_lima.AAC.1